jgi:hypothetical protein
MRNLRDLLTSGERLLLIGLDALNAATAHQA